jgi:GTPase SAR1 family protein
MDNEKMRAFCDKLHADGIDEWISLPEIAVIGDTSCGKSSLLSALSGIPLPANDQITTRCPLRLHMSKYETTSASIGVKWHATSDYASAEAYPIKASSSYASALTECEFECNIELTKRYCTVCFCVELQGHNLKN